MSTIISTPSRKPSFPRRSWRSESPSCSGLRPLGHAAFQGPAHLLVTSPHPVYESRPWALQSQGCGRQGDYIQVGGDLFRYATNNATYEGAARQLMAEWTKFRWGVFEQRGYAADPVFPGVFRAPGTGVLRENLCPGVGVEAPFCPSDAHVPEAPTKHNAQCRGRPQWDIISNSQDFSHQTQTVAR